MERTGQGFDHAARGKSIPEQVERKAWTRVVHSPFEFKILKTGLVNGFDLTPDWNGQRAS